MKKIRIIFCGICNPHIDPTKIINILKEKYEVSFTFLDDKPLKKEEILIIFNSCARKCLQINDYKSNKFIINTGNYLSSFENKSEDIAQNILDEIDKINI